ncbi:MAG: ectoine synthase [Planctomycetaceae bacterium]|nr:ectoine synthase [Planctomycetales bacterium]MCB9923398.1 ectoine synthase [Planctomycetaceae bacterium]
MIVRSLEDVKGTEREISGVNWTSRRLLLRSDKMGFSLHDTVIRAGTSTEMHYQNHLEAVYCIQGKGTVTVVETGEVLPIERGTMYALDQNDRHVLAAETTMRMVCVFNPPLTGPESHDECGVYPLIEEPVTTQRDRTALTAPRI